MARFKNTWAAGGALLLSSLATAWGVVRAVLDALGWATTAADMRHSHNIVQRGLGWLFDTPTFVPFLVAAVVVIAYVAWLWRADRRDAVPALSDTVNELKRKIATQIDEVYQANAAREKMRTERDALNAQVQDLTRQVQTAQTQSREVLRNIDQTTVPRAIAKGLADERDTWRQEVAELRAVGAENKELKQRIASAQPVVEAHERLKPMLTMHDRLLELIGGLFLFRAEMDRTDAKPQPPYAVTSIVDEWLDMTALQKDEFDKKYRVALVKLASDLKQQYGLVYPGLTDHELTLDVFGQEQIERYVNALQEAAASIDEKILKLVTERTSLGERQ